MILKTLYKMYTSRNNILQTTFIKINEYNFKTNSNIYIEYNKLFYSLKLE